MVRLSWQVPVLAASLVVAPVAGAEDDLPPITRDQVMANAATYAYQAWRASTANLRAPCDQSWSTDYTVGDYVGLPYNWGGFDDLASFQRKLSQGFGAGAHAVDGVLPCTTGVDCSGFISRVWRLPTKYSTSMLSEVTTVIHDIADVRPGDAWVKPGVHVVLHAYFRNDGTPVWYEASGGADKVRFMTSGSWAQLDGYQPVRYRGIRETVDLSHAGTLMDPIPIPSFPYKDTRNTVLAASDEMDEYTVQGGHSRGGPRIRLRRRSAERREAHRDRDAHRRGGPGRPPPLRTRIGDVRRARRQDAPIRGEGPRSLLPGRRRIQQGSRRALRSLHAGRELRRSGNQQERLVRVWQLRRHGAGRAGGAPAAGSGAWAWRSRAPGTPGRRSPRGSPSLPRSP